MSSARRARAAALQLRKELGTYVPAVSRERQIRRVLAGAAHVNRERESVFFEATDVTPLATTKRKPSAVTHQSAPPDQATPWRALSADTVPDVF